MKRTVIIILVLILTAMPVVAMTTMSNTWQYNIKQGESRIVDKDDTGRIFLVYTSKVLSFNFFDIEVKAVEATVVVNASNMNYEHIKVVVAKGETEYIYNVNEDVEVFPLQMGTGNYKVSLLGSTDGRRYRQLSVKNFYVELEENAVFLSASQTVNWNSESEVSILAEVLTEKADTNLEKLEKVHEYIINNVKYDYKKAASLPKGYVPNPVTTLDEGTGICYDFAALLAAMMRSLDVPAKLIKGYSTYTPVYHAWNEVLVDDEWYVVDASTDSIFVDYHAIYTLRKNEDDYQTSKEY